MKSTDQNQPPESPIPPVDSDLYGWLPPEERAAMWCDQYQCREQCGHEDDDCVLEEALRADLEEVIRMNLALGTLVQIKLEEKGKAAKRTIGQLLMMRIKACKHYDHTEAKQMCAEMIKELGVRHDGVPSVKIDVPVLYYDRKTHSFWHQDESGVWQSINKETAAVMLGVAGLSTRAQADGSPSEVDRHLIQVIQSRGIDLAMALAGYPVGLHEVKGKRIIVTHSFHLIEPAGPACLGDARHIHAMINGLFGAEAPYLLSHLKLSYEALRDFRLTGGLACIICGDVDCGKSLFLDGIITPLLGGRKADTFAFLGGSSGFNDEMVHSEVHTVDDANPFENHEARRRFGNAIKAAVAGGEYWCHGKGRAAFTVPIYRRLFVLVNPDDMELMPELTDSLVGKIMILKACRFQMPEDCRPLPEWSDKGAREEFLAQLREELPFFIRDLMSFEIPADLSDRRFGLMAYQNAELMGMIDEVSSLHEKSSVIQKTLYVDGDFADQDQAEVEVNVLYECLLTLSYKDRARLLFRNARALGAALGRLSHSARHRQSYRSRRSNGKTYWIIGRREEELKVWKRLFVPD